MKLLPTLLACGLLAVLFPSFGWTETVPVPEKVAGYLLQVEHATVATLPGLPSDQMAVTADQVTRFDADTLELSGAKILITLPEHAPVTITGDHLTLVMQKGEDKPAAFAAPVELPFHLPTEVVGIKKAFAGGDAIGISAITGTATSFRVGEIYRITGVCRQETLRHALLYVGNTAERGTEAIAPVAGSALTAVLPAGSTPFDCTFKLLRPGALHATIYDLDNHDPHDNAYAGVALGTVVADR